jgi:hypothetical protein
MENTPDINELMKFDTSHWKGEPCEGKRVGLHWISKALFVKCWQQFQPNIKTADWTKKQTARSLFNVPSWTSTSFGTRIAIGRVLRFFVKNEWLPLKVLNPKATGTKQYEWRAR